SDHYYRAIRTVLADDTVDAVLVVFTPPLVTRADDVAAAIAQAAEGTSKPVVANFLAMSGSPKELRNSNREVPSFAFPESAARALGRAYKYAAWRRRPAGTVPVLGDVHPADARAVVQTALAAAGGPCWLEPADATALLSSYGVPVARSRTVA